MRSVSGLSAFSLCWLLSCSRAEPRPSAAALPSAATEVNTGNVGPLAESVPSDSGVSGADGATAPSAAPPAALPTAAFPTVDGPALLARIRKSGLKGVLVNAYASWCGSCEHELPMLQAVSSRLKSHGIEIWLVTVDEPEAMPQARALLDSLHITLPGLAAAPPLSDFKAALTPRWPGMIPATFLFDGTGKLRYFWGGEVFENELKPIMDGFIAGKHIDGATTFGLAPGATKPSHE